MSNTEKYTEVQNRCVAFVGPWLALQAGSFEMVQFGRIGVT